MAPTMSVTCGMCQEVFDSDLNFTDHFLLVHTTDQLESEDEQSAIPASKNLVLTKKHASIGLHICEICGERKHHPRRLAMHILSHIGAMPYYCAPCGFACISKLRLQQHMFNHGSEKCQNQRYWLFTKSNMHECEVCHRGFSVWIDLMLHFVKHIQEMPYKCEKCSLYFNDLKDFKIHAHIHNFSTACEICSIFFDSKPRLLDHVIQHNKLKLFRKFRHIHWNNGVSPVRNPLTVLRADYYGNSLNQVAWKPSESAVVDSDDSLYQCEVTDFEKYRKAENEEYIVYENREDVRHLCEVVFREISDANFRLEEFHSAGDKQLETFSSNSKEEKILEKTLMPKHKTKANCKRSQNKQKSKVLEKNKNCSKRVANDEPYVDSDGNQNAVSSSESSYLEEKESTTVAESVKLKKLCVVLEKLPDDISDLKSFRRFQDRQRKKRAKLRWARIAEMRKSECTNVPSNADSSTGLVTRSGRVIKVPDTIQNYVISPKNSKHLDNEVNVFSNQKKEVEHVDLNSIKSNNESNKKNILHTPIIKVLRSGKILNGTTEERISAQAEKSTKVMDEKIVAHTKKSVNAMDKKTTARTKHFEIPSMDDPDESIVHNIKAFETANVNNSNNSNTFKKHNSFKKHSFLKLTHKREKLPPKSTNEYELEPLVGTPEKISHSFDEPGLSEINIETNSQNGVIHHDHNYQTNNPSSLEEYSSKIERKVETEQSSIKKTHKHKNHAFSKNRKKIISKSSNSLSVNQIQKNSRIIMKNSKKGRIQSLFSNKRIIMKNSRKGNNLSSLSNKRIVIKNRKNSKSIRENVLISKAKSQEVRVNLVRLPHCIYEKYLKTKPIMLSNILPVISDVTSLGTSTVTTNMQNYYSLMDHNYSDVMPFVLEEHNYCKFYTDDSDSESTISSYSDIDN